MNQPKDHGPPSFQDVVESIPGIGRQRHGDALVAHALANLPNIKHTVRDLPPPTGEKARSGIVISAGPSIHKRQSVERIRDSGYKGAIIAVDASYVACLRKGVIPDYLVTLDPHPTRMVRWFGDKQFEEHAAKDDYFQRQDLNVEFRQNAHRQNQENIELVNTHGHKTVALVASSAPANVVERLREARFPMYWWNPLVDDPRAPDSLTRKLFELNRLPSLNTGGNVGAAAWVFASATLKLPTVGLVGMDLGYYPETPYKLTQTYYELAVHAGGEEGMERYFQDFTFPLTGERYYTDPTYFWYRKNLLQLVSQAATRTCNCTEGGTLFGPHISCISLDEFLKH